MRKNLISLLLLCLTLGWQSQAVAQEKHPAKIEKKQMKVRMTPEQNMEMRTAFIAQQLMLDDATTAKFSALYKRYLTELQSCRFKRNETFGAEGRVSRDQMTDAQIEKSIEARFATARRVLDIREKYYREFKKILNPRQIQKMYRAEKSVQKKVRKEMERRQRKAKGDKKRG